MNFEKLVPNVYYVYITKGLKFFADCLEFTIGHNEIKSSEPFCVLEKGGLQIYLFENVKLAKEQNPKFLHPNFHKITLRPWGLKNSP
ncbi:hypothetical protein [Adhaeribacter radiodurans]|uniref:Uncharacterized protein n=1 Tax=Adhaeribacter radiodurans TaxID=2745197 RepID=A0A7L7LA61_9BACT|nr:hypothetical protein [Adhaeribacter radiodurans]QMU29710.1 hypothetical protein HUW48_17500 [Adhaeribacter radiodurans]